MDTICHIITKLELGGAQEVALYAVSHLDRARFRPVLLAGAGGLLTEEARRLPGVQTIIVPSLGRRIHAISDLLAFLHLVILLRRLKPAIVHTHSSKAGILGRWAAWCARVPLILHTVHGFGITPAQPRWMRRLFILLERITGWITTHWITVAEIDVRHGREWKLFDGNVSVIRPGIDPAPFTRPLPLEVRDSLRRELGIGSGEYLIGTVACLKPQKAPDDVIAVAGLVSAAIPEARFVVIGDGILRPQIEALIKEQGLQDRVRLAGWRRDVPRAMGCFDLLLLTSRWEGLPRVMLEAAAARLPIVATRVGGVEEAVVLPDRVRLYEAGDITGLATGVETLLRASRAGDRRPSAGESPLPKEFHVEEMVKQYQSLYDRLLSQPHNKLVSGSLSPASPS
ncbi:MAG TPA: glycosyltransferase [Nitrospira sp.]|nr:glycosyltransferase [Nitrospira sp.]